MSRFPNKIPTIQPEAPISSQDLRSAFSALEYRTDYLLQKLQDSTSGEQLRVQNLPCAPDVRLRSWVYYDAESRLVRPAAALAVQDDVGGVALAPQALVLGFVTEIANGLANVVTQGIVTLSYSQYQALFEDPGDAPALGGVLFLDKQGGYATTARLLPLVPLGAAFMQTSTCDGECRIAINPAIGSWYAGPAIREYALAAYPAGDHVPPAKGGTHVITSPNASIQGWLPANHAVFNGTAPVGAKFGYNISLDPTLQSLWPPSTAHLLFYSEADMGVVGFVRIPSEQYVIDENTIWWMKDCYSQVPWNHLLNNTIPPPPAVSCDITVPTQLLLVMDRPPLDRSMYCVTRLRPSASGAIRFVNQNNQEASQGDLQVVFSPANATTVTNALGSLVVKDIDEDFTIRKGVVVEGMRSGSSNLTLTGSTSRLVDPLLPESPSNPRIHQGIVVVSSAGAGAGLELTPALVRLGDTLQKTNKGLSYIEFPAGPLTTLTYRFDIDSRLVGSLELRLVTTLYSPAAGPWPDLQIDFQIVDAIPRTQGQQRLDDVVTATGTLSLSTLSPVPVAGAFAKATSTPQTCYAGDTVFVTVKRAAGNAFNAPIGIVRALALVTPV
jgi:hypothetical protein